MPDIELFDETLDINATENYKISIQVGLDGFSFALQDTIRNKIILFRSYEPEERKGFRNDEISNIIDRDDFLSRSYKSTVLVHPSKRTTMIPAGLFDPAKKETYFYFNHTRAEDEEIWINKVKYPESYLLYSVPIQLAEILSERFPEAGSLSHLKSILHYSTVTGKKTTDPHIHLHIEKGFFNLIYCVGKRVSFCNTFTFKNVSDIMYYLFYIFELLGLKQDTPIVISGRSDFSDELYQNIAEYSKGVQYAAPPSGSFFSYAIEELPLHRYINLFNAFHCE